MVALRKTLQAAHGALTSANIDHALIGGLALATLGINRATGDVDLLVDAQHREELKRILGAAGFVLKFETPEVLQFEGLGYLDVLLANRPISKAMLSRARHLSTVGMKCLDAEDIIGLKIQAYVNNPKREYQERKVTFQEYLDFLDEYWEMFGPVPEPQRKAEYQNVKI